LVYNTGAGRRKGGSTQHAPGAQRATDARDFTLALAQCCAAGMHDGLGIATLSFHRQGQREDGSSRQDEMYHGLNI
jgi:hypothetical protein